jgi:single-strand DNA-binding protein
MNKVTLIGRLGADPEMRYTPSGVAICQFRMVTTEHWNDRQGQRQERTEWHRLIAWNGTAELCVKYLFKGNQCAIDGSLHTYKWKDREGKDRYTTQVTVNKVEFLGGNKKHSTSEASKAEEPVSDTPPTDSHADKMQNEDFASQVNNMFPDDADVPY